MRSLLRDVHLVNYGPRGWGRTSGALTGFYHSVVLPGGVPVFFELELLTVCFLFGFLEAY